MKYVYSWELLILQIFVTVTVTGAKPLLRSQDAVTSLLGSEDFYVHIKRKIPKTYVDDGQSGQLRNADYTGEIRYEDFENLEPTADLPKPEDAEVKEDLADKGEICARIFNRFLFEINQEHAANFALDEEHVREELHKNHRDIYNDIYANWPEVKGEWLNPYRQRVVVVGNEKFNEYVFRCVTRKKTDEAYTYLGYFISPIYRSLSDENLFMDGRFIFTANDENEELEVFAMADESAVISPYVIQGTHEAYYNARKHRHKELDAKSNVLCNLSKRDKIRLCTIALNVPNFPDVIKFFPREDFIEPDCEKKSVLARLEVSKQKWYSIVDPEYETFEVELKYNEWMVTCRAAQLVSENQWSMSTYYISKGLNEFSAIIFEETEEDSCEPYLGLNYVLMAKGRNTIKRIWYNRKKVEK